MIRVGWLSSFVLIGVLMSGTAHAQESKTLGVTIGYPSSLGVLWRAADTFAVRPDFTFSGNSLNLPEGAGSSGASNVGVGVAVLLYLKSDDHLRTYIAPRFDYGYTRTHSDTTATSSMSSSRWGAGATGLFGTEYSPVTKFGIFAEVGFGFSHSTVPSLSGGSNGTANTWGTRAGVGVVFYP